MALGRKTGGRKKGSKNRKVVNLEATAAAQGISPLDVMLKAMRLHAEAERWDEAAEKAKDAAPYVHARLSAVELNGDMRIRRTIRREPMTDEQMAKKHDVQLPTHH